MKIERFDRRFMLVLELKNQLKIWMKNDIRYIYIYYNTPELRIENCRSESGTEAGPL